MAGYSGTPLVKKLGIRPGSTILLDGETPRGYPSGEAGVVRRLSRTVDLVHLFTRRASELQTRLRRYRRGMRDDAVIWISWPKKSSKVPTDITEDVVRALALQLGLVDIKVCAVDDVWSGLKLVIRREERRQVPSRP